MDVTVNVVDHVTVVEMAGELDGKTSAEVQERIMPVVQTAGKVLLDMGRVSYMSSAGLRLLLSIYRQMSAKSGRVALTGVRDEIRDTMSVTGFLRFFDLYETAAAGIAALKE